MTELKNTERELHFFRMRLTILAALVFVCFSLLLARFIWLQVIKHEDYATKAEDNRIAVVPIVPTRGLILDRNGVVLARNYSDKRSNKACKTSGCAYIICLVKRKSLLEPPSTM